MRRSRSRHLSTSTLAFRAEPRPSGIREQNRGTEACLKAEQLAERKIQIGASAADIAKHVPSVCRARPGEKRSAAGLHPSRFIRQHPSFYHARMQRRLSMRC